MEIKKLGAFVPNKTALYDFLTAAYVLPEYNSHACSLAYLNKYTEKPILIYVCEIQGTEIFKRRYKSTNAEELLDLFEKLLVQKNKPPTGLDIFNLPDVAWLCTVLHKEDPTDNVDIFKKKFESLTVTRTLNEKYVVMLYCI